MITVIEQEKIKQLSRIANALEDINSALRDISVPLERLEDCVGYVPPTHCMKDGYHVLRISGSVYNE